MSSALSVVDEPSKSFYLNREKCSHIIKAARSATIANILAPLLCIPVFQDDVRQTNFLVWLSYMFVVVTVRTVIVANMPHKPEEILDPTKDLRKITWVVGAVGFGWGLGWPLMTPDLSMVDRMIYVYMTTAAMIASMFAYSVNRPTFYAFTVPIMLPAMSTLLWPTHIFPWPFSVGLATLYLVVLGIAKNFAKVFDDSVGLRFRNERLYQELASERDQSVSANIAKSKFIAVASHDLRQPLQAINVNLDLFEPDDLQPKGHRRLQKIKRSVTTLNNMFDALLNMSKLDAYNTKPNNRYFALDELSDSVLETVQSLAKNKGIQLVIHKTPGTVYGDPLLLQQILVNLALNAIQYTEQGSVEVRFVAVDHALVFTVRDSGVGIADLEQAHIFKEFYRVNHTRAHHEGLGLGLSIVKRLCELIGASIAVESAPGQGATFTVTTQCPVGEEEDTPPVVAPPRVQGDKPSHLVGKRIAIIEDDEVILDAYRQMLSLQGAQVVALSDAPADMASQLEALDQIDGILCDYRLAHTTGDQLIQRLRENYNWDIPAVIVTADTSPAHIETFAKLNAPILYKPVTFQTIIATLEEVLKHGESLPGAST
jgi:signal transduction histidine kinase/CheY-like chemotaxis protein